jgi:hypothetical protein
MASSATLDDNDGRHPPQRLDLKVGNWLDGRFYVADVCGGVATVLVQTLEHTRQEIQERGERIRAARKQADFANKAARRRRSN